MIEITLEQVERIEKLVGNIKRGPSRVLYNAINRGLSRIRAISAKEASQRFTVSASQIKSNSKASIKNASPNANTVGMITISGKMIPIYKFQVTGKGGRGGKVKVQVKKGGGGTLQHAFVANLGHGSNVLERTSAQRNSSETIFGPSAAHMIGHNEIAPHIEQEAQEVVNKRIEHEIERLLNGINV